MMGEITQEMMIYHRLSIICLMGMILTGVIAIYSYRKMNMKAVLGYFWRKRKGRIVKSVLLSGILLGCSLSFPAMAVQLNETTEDGVEQPKEEETDEIAPILEVIYTNENGQFLISNEEGTELFPYYNPAKEIVTEFKVTEEFLDEEKSVIKVVSKDRAGNFLKEDVVLLEEGCGQTVIKEDGHYLVEAYLVDMTGNETIYEKIFALDYTPPKEPVMKYKTENQGFLERMVHQLTFGYFAKEKLTASILVEDTVSGVKQVTYSYQDADTEKIVTQTVTEPGGEITVELPFSFRGKLWVSSEDYLGNVAEIFTDIGVIAESEVTHEETMTAEVQVLTDYSKTPNYYADDVNVKFVVGDAYSGIRNVTYLAGKDTQQSISYEEETEIVTEEIVKEYQISAADNQSNEVPIGVSFEDHAGHRVILEEENLPKVHIDTISPKVQIVYDNYDAENEKYYRESRTATVYIEERNFDPEDVSFDIDGPETEIHRWSHVQGEGCGGSGDPYDTEHTDLCVWKTEVEFKEDGEYRFGFSCTDFAGNRGSYEHIDEFIIDKTSPQIQVDYDNVDVRNELYYHAPRTARITITETNFEPRDVEIYLTAENEGQLLKKPHVSNWISNGEHHQAVINYDYDGVFSFDISYADLAGNEADDYSEEYFIIDLTSPQILIGKVEDKSANNGKVSPVIMVTDTNFMWGSTWTELIGWQNGLLDIEKTAEDLQNGIIIHMNDFAHIKEMDDLYRLTVGAEDFAGNAAKIQIRFSVNRFGSVYTLDSVTEKLAGERGTYYTDKEKRIVITETNVDTLVFQEIVCSLNGKLKILEEDVDYKVEESGDDTSWKQYRYIVFSDNFAEEGHYTLTVYSEDRANNVSNNQSKGKSISFAVDKTAPDIVISGIEPRGRYKENSRELMIDVQDNLGVEKLMVFLNNEAMVYDMETLYKADGKINITIEGDNQWQTLKAVAKDCTENEVTTEEMTFLVTPNVLVQFYNHKPLFYGSLVFSGIAIFIVLHKILRFSLFNSSNS